MAKNKTEYTEIARAAVTESRNIVISDCSRGGYTIAQQVVAKEGDRETPVFMKGAFHIDDIHGLYNLRDSLNLAILTIENRESDELDWDDLVG